MGVQFLGDHHYLEVICKIVKARKGRPYSLVVAFQHHGARVLPCQGKIQSFVVDMGQEEGSGELGYTGSLPEYSPCSGYTHQMTRER